MTQRAHELERIFARIADLPPDQQAAAIASERPSIQNKLHVLVQADAEVNAHSRARRIESHNLWNAEVTRSIRAPAAHVQDGNSDTIVTSPTIVLDVPASPTGSTPPEDQDIAAPGTRIEQYEIIRAIGRGGMGAVYLARDTRLGRKVAIKFLNARAGAGMVRRFIMEARATARCTHENIVVIHDVSVYHDHPYMVLEYLRGKPLSRLMSQGNIPPNRAVELVIPVVRALTRAHASDIVHRDLKPDNIILTDSGVIKVLDFGVAKLVHQPAALRPAPADLPGAHPYSEPSLDLLPDHLTQHGALVGTMSFMSPEQWHGRGIDHRSDIWAVGILLYIMVTGRHPLAPFRGMQLAITGLIDQPMPSAQNADVELPAGLVDIIDTCLRKHKQERFASAEALLEALEELLRASIGHSRAEASTSPYTGLTAFQEADADRFFGRSREIANIMVQVHDTPLLAVIGPSGVGKSSFVRAGVISTLKRTGEAWESINVRPGRHPLAALANIIAPLVSDDSASLSAQVAEHQRILNRLYVEPGYLGTVLRERACDHDRKIILFIDQFEELYTLSPDLRERLAFTACLSGMADDPASPLRVIISIRSDFLDRVAEDHRFTAEMSQGLFFLTPPGRQGLRDALVQPAEMRNYRFETSAMVDHMLDALERTPGSLPLLQFTAAKLWDQRDTRRRLLSEHSYHAMGGMVGALASHADAVLTGLAASAQNLVRTIFLRLVTPERTRAIASVSELRELSHHPDAVERLVGQLVDARLLVIQRGDAAMGPAVEIVHESLVHSWPTLTRWLDESQEDVAFLEQLRQAARQWDDKGRPIGLLWRGEAMEDARRWRARYRDKLSALQEEYLRAVFLLGHRSARRRRLAVVGSFVFLSALVAAAAVALVLIRDAQQEAVAQADKARSAEAEVRDQLTVIQQTQAQLSDVEAQVTRARVTLAAIEDQRKAAKIELQAARTQIADARREAEQSQQQADRAMHTLKRVKVENQKELRTVQQQSEAQAQALQEQIHEKDEKLNEHEAVDNALGRIVGPKKHVKGL